MAVVGAKYYPEVNQGIVFMGSTAAAGVVPPAYNATAHTFALWNPLGSGKNLVLLRFNSGWVSTTGAPGNLCIAYQTGVGAQVATGAAITAATLVAPLNAKIGGGAASVAKFAPATLTLAAASSLLCTIGASQLTITGASTAVPQWTIHKDLDGSIIVPPGVMIGITGNVSLTSVMDHTLWWAEVPE